MFDPRPSQTRDLLISDADCHHAYIAGGKETPKTPQKNSNVIVCNGDLSVFNKISFFQKEE